MNKTELQQLFQNPYSHSDWLEVLTSVFGAKQLYSQPQPILLPSNQQASKAFELGSFTTSDDRVIGLYQIDLNENVWLQRNKVGLRELLRNVYKYDVDGAIVVFVQDEKWRLSFVSEIKVLDDEGEVVEQATEPKRYTYLLGEGEKVKTPSDRLSKLTGKTLALKDILDAFSVEALNEEFYKIVQQYFYHLVGGKIGKGKKQTDYGNGTLNFPDNITISHQAKQEFAVRLIGRMIFCWFLKMKHTDEEGTSLLPELLLSSRAVKDNENYYHSILERLFFQTLNTPMKRRLDNLPDGAENIPFLNGGLFEPRKDDFYELNPKTGVNQLAKTSYIQNNWFLHFFEELEKYNFTIDENSVTEIEVSVDPEMLGRIFENLLAEIDPDTGDSARKATGSFYTPREIVDYMATESLVQYIHNKTKIENDKLRPIFKMLDANDPDFSKVEKEGILDALDGIKILDPACGSGAFPMGVLQKIVQALQKLDPDARWWKKRQVAHIKNPVIKKQLKEKLAASGVEYARKIGIIQNSLYGVDIQPVAAQISKLRCFLSLIVDETIDDSKENRGIEPLPNLEFKFVTADTLMKLPEDKEQHSLFDNFEELQELEDLRNEYIQSYGKKKQRLKSKFTATQQKIAKDQSSLFADKESKAYKLGNWNPFGHEKSDWFDPKWMFGVEKFDVVIGNPPYVQLQKEGGKLAKQYQSCNYKTFRRTGDIYSLFYERGWEVLIQNGILCFITSNKWMRAGYGENTRKFFAENTDPIQLIDFAGQKVFAGATVDTNILLFAKDKNRQQTQACVIKEKVLNNLSVYFRQNVNHIKFDSSESWVVLSPIEMKIKRKIEKKGTPLKDWDIRINYGIKTGFNQAFIIDGSKRKELIEQDPKSAEIIRPILRGRDIKRYSYDFADKYILFIPWHFPLHNDPSIKGASKKAEEAFKEQYPAVFRHLLGFKERLSKRNQAETGIRYEWYALQRWGANYWDDFYKQKIIFQEMVQDSCFILDQQGEYMCLDTARIIVGDNLDILLAVMNSKLFFYSIKTFYGGGGLGNTGVRMKHTFFEKFPMPPFSEKELIEIETYIQRPIEYSKLIDKMIYSTYNFEEKEIELIENE